MADLLEEVAWERLEYRRVHGGMDLHEETIKELLEMGLGCMGAGKRLANVMSDGVPNVGISDLWDVPLDVIS